MWREIEAKQYKARYSVSLLSVSSFYLGSYAQTFFELLTIELKKADVSISVPWGLRSWLYHVCVMLIIKSNLCSTSVIRYKIYDICSRSASHEHLLLFHM